MLVQVLNQIKLRPELPLQLLRADVDNAALLRLGCLFGVHLVLIYNYIVTRRRTLSIVS